MYGVLTRTWWLVLLRGVMAVALGAALLTERSMAVSLVAVAFGGFAVLDGTVAAAVAVAASGHDTWPLRLDAVVGLAAGLVALSWPGIAALPLLALVAAWAAARGGTQVWGAWGLHRQCPNEMTLLGAAVAVLSGAAVVAAHSSEGMVVLEHAMGAAVAAAGALLLVLAGRLWYWMRASRRIETMAIGPEPARHERAA
jgi:uncharacterized membrane protein HdeD (DUF308 family)